MRSTYEIQAEEVEITGKIKQLEETASNEVDKRELKRLRKRAYEIQDDLTIARNKERQAQKEVSIQYVRESETKNQESYAEMMQLAGECLPKLKKVNSLLKRLAVSQNKLVFSGRDAQEEARRVQLQFGDTNVDVNVKSLPVITAINPTAIGSYIEKLELLLKENKVEEVNEDAKVSAV